MINKLTYGAKKSRTIRVSILDMIIGGIVTASPVAIEVFSSAPVVTKDSPLSVWLVFGITILSGVYKLWSGGYHAWLRYQTTGAIGENK